ncbi:hypothetical protein T492DRAFT_846002 [Pavlovales sp. CCMP2436]|nr:hypothetical protein T492DRAFT_846002 [Pavlovales sp. CCMP2436]
MSLARLAHNYRHQPAPSQMRCSGRASQVYSINCHDLGSLIKSISQHQQLRSLVVVQQLYDGTTLTFAPHHVRVMHTDDANGLYPAQAYQSELTTDVTKQAKTALVSQLNAVGDHRAHRKKLAALFAAMVVSLNCSR